MLKIPEKKKYRNLPDYMKEHLTFIPTSSTRSAISLFCLVLLDMCVLPFLYPRNDLIYMITIPLLVFIHLWMIRLLIKNPRFTQMETILFMSVFSTIGAICYFITSLKVSYVFIGITNVWYYVVLSVVHIIISLYLIQYQVEKYSKIDYKRNESEKWYKRGSLLSLLTSGSGIGYVLFQTTKDSETAMHSLFLCVSIFFTCFLAYFAAKFTHKYFFIKLNRRLVDINTPTKRQIK
ncbi:hypothetical protein [Pseudalkalibacillus hwajinpoensis]|uniref:hypothetical protein n=1 Tax=Guptibacillus hwajinpoensis TaxID=208199 RepID=UPI001CD2D8B4|nr:hypothetical protein [Pseudalkalibacillus hwajinpoensis]MCA0993820.1 hypothetical protein [Pseudalkalibacillus hwajinpoensis]